MRTLPLLAAAAAALTLPEAQAQRPAPAVLRPGDLVWQPAPPVLEPGAQAAILAGHPGQPGPVTIRIRVPDQYRIAPHRHSGDEFVTVLSGSLCFAIGEPAAPAPETCLGPGGFAAIPAGTPHAVRASGATEYQIQALGPFEMSYLDPADDPSRRSRAPAPP
ncbi:MAG TPA: cupin domain-containing protein [Gemmatimonadales bacterium]|nr:cupin domain-containing protein [Gemmatimonadales bacterium]